MRQMILAALSNGSRLRSTFKARMAARAGGRQPGREPFHAVSIRTCGASCPAVRELAGRRYLSAAAPRLPLPECDREQCNCSYRHFADRRQEARRDGEDDYGRRGSRENRRRKVGRRADDQPAPPQPPVADYYHHAEETQRRLRRLRTRSNPTA